MAARRIAAATARMTCRKSRIRSAVRSADSPVRAMRKKGNARTKAVRAPNEDGEDELDWEDRLTSKEARTALAAFMDERVTPSKRRLAEAFRSWV